jgi:short-subunit dehydrogenase
VQKVYGASHTLGAKLANKKKRGANLARRRREEEGLQGVFKRLNWENGLCV